MRRFLIWAFLLWISLMGRIAIAVSIGNQHPLPHTLKQLRLADCLIPCWAGITPEKTSRDDAIKQIAALSGTLTLYSSNVTKDAAAFSFRFPTNIENDRAKTIDGLLFFQNDRILRIR